jgi:hypothetical protein
MERKRVVFQGVEMDFEWPSFIVGAQTDLIYVIGGKTYERIRYGSESEDWGSDSRPCHDCAVIKGQLHVRGCDAEECPECHGQVLACDCPIDRANSWGDDSDES